MMILCQFFSYRPMLKSFAKKRSNQRNFRNCQKWKHPIYEICKWWITKENSSLLWGIAVEKGYIFSIQHLGFVQQYPCQIDSRSAFITENRPGWEWRIVKFKSLDEMFNFYSLNHLNWILFYLIRCIVHWFVIQNYRFHFHHSTNKFNLYQIYFWIIIQQTPKHLHIFWKTVEKILNARTPHILFEIVSNISYFFEFKCLI